MYGGELRGLRQLSTLGQVTDHHLLVIKPLFETDSELIEPLETNFGEILSKIHKCIFCKMHLNIISL